jgi:hypothetical protein
MYVYWALNRNGSEAYHWRQVAPWCLVLENLWGNSWGKAKEEESGTRLVVMNLPHEFAVQSPIHKLPRRGLLGYPEDWGGRKGVCVVTVPL